MLLVFNVGFHGLDLSRIHNWTNAETDQALVAGMILMVTAVLGLIWLLLITSKAISVSNDIATGEAALSSLLAAVAAGVVFIVVGMVMQLPMGLFL
jgi:zinc transporter ZupT